MSNGSPISHKLLEKLAEKRAAEAAQKQQQQNDLSQWAEYVPDIEIDTNVLPQQELAFDEFFRITPITEAYQKWCGKSPIIKNGVEVKASCPNPDHPDSDPSCSFNTKKNVFMCFKCGFGGDIYTLAALNKGYPVPGYQEQSLFRQLKNEMLADFGLHVETTLAGEKVVVQQEFTQEPPPNVSCTPEGAAQAAKEDEEDELDPKRLHEEIKWRNFVPENTFLRAYLEATTTDTCPEEFHFWLGMQALGLAVGRNVTLNERSPVKANLFVCLTGPSGTGKSRAKSTLLKLIRDNIPYKKDDAVPEGTRILSDAASGEIIVKMFQHEIVDLSTGKGTGSYLPVRVLFEAEELAGIVTKSSRQGNSLKDVMSRMYDCHDTIESNSLANQLAAILPFGSALTTTQNKSIRDLVTKKDDNSGFVNRWIFATGVMKTPTHIDRTSLDLTRAGGLIRLINSQASKSYSIDWDQDADKLYEDFFHSRIVPLKRSVDSNLLERIDLTMKKVFLLLAINKREKTLTRKTVLDGLHVWDYLCESYGVVEKQIAATETGDNQDFVLKTIQRLSQNGKSTTANHIYKASKHRIPDVGTVRKMLENFCALGVVTEFRKPAGTTGGRPSTVYVLSSQKS
jgi:energy-coupling factor transporter ATP-binding protein EcfA2